MAFGCGIGDFIQVTRLLAQTISSFKHAPTYFREAEETVRNLEILFAGIRSEIEKPESVFVRDPAQGERFELLTQSCVVSLQKLDDLLARHQSLGSDNIRVIDRFRFSKKEVVELQRELALRHANLATFLEALGLGGVGRIEYKVDGLAQQQDRIIEAIDRFALQTSARQETASILSQHTNDDKAVWKQLRRDLNSAGFVSSDIEKHKTLIHQKLTELRSSGKLEWNPEDDVDDTKSDMSIVWIGRTKKNYKPPTAETIYEGSEDEGNYTHRPFRPGSADPLFEDSDEDLLDRTGVQEEKNAAVKGGPPPYPGTASTPRLQIPRPAQTQSAGNSPQARYHAFPRNLPGMGGTSPRQPRPEFPMSPPKYGSLPRTRGPIPLMTRNAPARPGSSGNVKRGEEVRVGKRSVPNIVWRYRRPAELQRPPMQSADLGDGTLPKAASEGRTADVQRLLAQGHNIESTGSRAVSDIPSFENTTALYRALRKGHFETAHALLRFGANPNVTKNDGKSLLRLLVSDGDVELVRLLLEYGANPQKQGALPQAALFGHLSIVQVLLNYGADINEVEKQTALYRADAKGFSDIVDLLLREGADTSFVAPSGPSALFKAVANDHFKCTRSLLLYGARPEVGCGPEGETALHAASSIGHEPTVRLLLEHGAKPNDVGYRHYQAAVQKQDGQTEEFYADGPLLAAVRSGRLVIARLLIDYGADVNMRTHFGQTAIDLAFQRNDAPLVDMLYAAGARLSPQTIEAAEKREAWERQRENDLRHKDDPRKSRHPSTAGADPDGQEARNLQMPEFKRRSKSSSTARPTSSRSKGGSASSGLKVGATATAGMLLLDSLMLLGG